MHLVSVLLPLPLDNTFAYKTKQNVEVGDLVKVTFNNKESLGIIFSLDSKYTEYEKIKEILFVCDNSYRFSKKLISFIKWVAEYNIAPLGAVLKMIMPSSNKLADIENLDIYKNNLLGYKPVQLTKQQQAALSQMSLSLGSFSTTVLDGVTGSGKTEVYLELIKQVIEQGQQALVLLPEIVLTTQLVKRFTERFGFAPLKWHSGLTIKQRRLAWKAVKQGIAKFIVGARSALFLPFDDLKLIIVDEEHDVSFKQEEGVIYNARDMAIIRSKIEKIPIILASATPAIESLYNVSLGKYNTIDLPSRFGQIQMPKIELIDLNIEKLKKDTWISIPLRNAVINNYDNKQQTLLFLNRRGYAPITLCASCGNKLKCPDCDVYMVYHKKKTKLQCHYCGYYVSEPFKCPECGDHKKLLSLGPGVEKIANEVKEMLPDAQIALFTSDEVTSAAKADKLIQEVLDSKIDIIIGTQMIAKGLHFPKLQLVGVIEADNGFCSGDIRALERTYQLLQQVTGRAGRCTDGSKVMLQSYEPDNITLQHIIHNDRQKFIESEIEDRKLSNTPPFSRIVLITASSFNEFDSIKATKVLAQNFPIEDARVEILGPSPAPIYMLNKRYRNRVIIRADKKVNLPQLIRLWLSKCDIAKNIKIKIDVDPYSWI